MTHKNTTLMIVTSGLVGAMTVTAIAAPVEIPLGTTVVNGPISHDISPPLTSPVAEVIAAQGQTSVDYNCDGVIGSLDLLALVASGAFDINIFLDMMASWGTADYDINCDLIVDREDLLLVAAETSANAEAFVDAFRDHWDEQGTPYDLNCDDVVNALDYLHMVTDGSYTIGRLLGMLADWGASPHMFDLNCDGVVGIQDFLAGLAALTNGQG